jgi:hypothetical protein
MFQGTLMPRYRGEREAVVRHECTHDVGLCAVRPELRASELFMKVRNEASSDLMATQSCEGTILNGRSGILLSLYVLIVAERP